MNKTGEAGLGGLKRVYEKDEMQSWMGDRGRPVDCGGISSGSSGRVFIVG